MLKAISSWAYSSGLVSFQIENYTGRKTTCRCQCERIGSGPNGGSDFKPLTESPHSSYIGVLMRGTVSIIDLPSDEQLLSLTEKVIANNFSFENSTPNPINPIPTYPTKRNPNQIHCLYFKGESDI